MGGITLGLKVDLGVSRTANETTYEEVWFPPSDPIIPVVYKSTMPGEACVRFDSGFNGPTQSSLGYAP